MPAHVTIERLRFCDTDRLGHVNNAVYATLCEAGRVDLLAELGLLRPDSTLVPVIVRLELDFLRELDWPGEVAIATDVLRLGTKSFTLRQELSCGGEAAARALSVLALLDTGTRRATALPEDWRAALARHAAPS